MYDLTENLKFRHLLSSLQIMQAFELLQIKIRNNVITKKIIIH